MTESTPDEPGRRSKPPIASITVFAFIGGYAVLSGVDHLAPDLLLLWVAAGCMIVATTMRDINRGFDNDFVSAIGGLIWAIGAVAATAWTVIAVVQQSAEWPGLDALLESRTIRETLENLGLMFVTTAWILWFAALVVVLGIAVYFDFLGGKRKKSN